MSQTAAASDPTAPCGRLPLLPLFALPLLALLAACGVQPSRPVPQRPVPQRPGPHRGHVVTPPAPIVRTPPPPARRQSLPGLEGVIGASAVELERMFGAPKLDVVEGDARKLQFSGVACVLDIYLYPPAQGQAPRATFVDARRAGDARDVDRAACVAALKRR